MEPQSADICEANMIWEKNLMQNQMQLCKSVSYLLSNIRKSGLASKTSDFKEFW